MTSINPHTRRAMWEELQTPSRGTNHGSEETRFSPSDNAEDIETRHAGAASTVYGAPSMTLDGRSGSIDSGSPSRSPTYARQPAVRNAPDSWTHAEVVDFLEKTLPDGSVSARESIAKVVRYKIDGAAMAAIMGQEATEVHQVLKTDLAIMEHVERLIVFAQWKKLMAGCMHQ